MHACVEAYVKVAVRLSETELLQPEEFLDTLKRERQKLYQYFKPSLA